MTVNIAPEGSGEDANGAQQQGGAAAPQEESGYMMVNVAPGQGAAAPNANNNNNNETANAAPAPTSPSRRTMPQELQEQAQKARRFREQTQSLLDFEGAKVVKNSLATFMQTKSVDGLIHDLSSVLNTPRKSIMFTSIGFFIPEEHKKEFERKSMAAVSSILCVQGAGAKLPHYLTESMANMKVAPGGAGQ